MKKNIKTLVTAIILSLSIFTAAPVVKADTNYASSLVEQALEEKTFYHFNIAYYETMKLTDENQKNILLGKLSTIENAVWRQDIKKIYRTLLDMVDTAGGRIYDSIQVDISKADIPEIDKYYLLGEVTSWGRKLVWTEDYGKAVDAIVKAWTDTDNASITDAQTAISQMSNRYSKGYLYEELAKIKAKQAQTVVSTVNNNANINNYGFIATDGEWNYYSDLSKEGVLSKAKLDGSEATKINDDQALFINVNDGWIYYINASDEGSIYKVAVDGTNKTKLTSDSAIYTYVSDDQIYYQNVSDGAKLYKMNLDGTGKVKLSDDIAGFINVSGEYIYYANLTDENAKGEIIRINAEGKGRTAINDVASFFINVVGDSIYYQDGEDGYIYKTNLDGTGKVKLGNSIALCLNVSDNWIYYVSYEDNYSLYRMSIDGTNNEKITDNDAAAINILGDKIYFFDTEAGEVIYSINKDNTDFKVFGQN